MIIETENNIGMFFIHTVNSNVVIHSLLLEEHVKINIFSITKKEFVLKDLIMEDSNYFKVDYKLAKGKYKITVETNQEKIEKSLTI